MAEMQVIDHKLRISYIPILDRSFTTTNIYDACLSNANLTTLKMIVMIQTSK